MVDFSKVQDWFGELSAIQKSLLLVGHLVALFLVLFFVRLKWGDSAVDFINVYASIILTFALVALYYRQASIQADQTEIMEFNRKIRETELNPNLSYKGLSFDGDLVKGKITNTGSGIALRPFFEISYRDSDTELIRAESEIFGPDDNRLCVIRPEESKEVYFKPKFPYLDANDEVRVLDIDEFRNASYSDDDQTFHSRFRAHNISDQEVTNRLQAEFNQDSEPERIFRIRN